MKDHKDNFGNHPTTRLINPTKNSIGGISKSVSDKIKICLRKKLKFNEQKNTTDFVNWFKKTDEKHLHTFTIFDIKEFHPSIKESLLKNTIQIGTYRY